MTLAHPDGALPVELDADQDGRYDDIDNVPVDTADPDEDPVGGVLVPFDESELPDPWQPSVLRGPIAHLSGRPLPTLESTKVSAQWWARNLSRAGATIVVRSPQLSIEQIPHIYRGVCRCGRGYGEWRGQSDWMAAAKKAEDKDQAKHVSAVKRRQRANARLTWLALLASFGGGWWAYAYGYGWYLVGAAAFILLILDLIGRRGAPPSAVAIMPRSHFQEGAPARMVLADVRAVLVGMGHDEETTIVAEGRVGKYGIAMQVHSTRELDETTAAAIERGLQAYRGAVQLVADPENAAITEVRAFWTDPLAISLPPARLAPLSMSVAVPAILGYGIGHVPLELPLMRVNIGVVGKPGSGKSSTLWTIIDWLSCCHDVKLYGIDLTGGPALRSWGAVFEHVAYDPDDALKLLTELVDRAKARTHLLAERSEPKPGAPPPESENWTPEDALAGRGLFEILIVDELPVMANEPELIKLYAEHQRIGRKAGSTSVWTAQDLTGPTLGATAIRKYPSTLIFHACSRQDVSDGMGGGKIKEGWAPHRLVPAEGDSPNDAGKAYVSSGRHNRPVQWRFFRLDDLREIHSRALERIEAGRPTDGATAALPTGPPEPDVVDSTPVPPTLANLAAIFRAAGEPEFLATETILAELQAITGKPVNSAKLAADLRRELPNHEIDTHRPRVDGKLTRGYRWADILAAQDAL